MEKNDNTNKNGAIELLRIIATTGILMHHYQQFTGGFFDSGNAYGPFPWGQLVEFFFLLSGYLSIKYISLLSKTLTLKEFMVKKAVRLLPTVAIGALFQQVLFFAGEMMTSKIRIVDNPWDCLNPWTWLTASLGIDTGGAVKQEKLTFVTWYVSVLLLCYFVFALAVKIAHRLHFSANLLFAALVLLGISIVSYQCDVPFFNVHAARGYYAFFFGVLLACVFDILKRIPHYQIYCVIAICLSIIYLFGLNRLYQAWGEQFIMTFVLYPGMIFACENSRVNQLFNRKMLFVLGDCSFTVYVFQLPFIYCMMFICSLVGQEYHTKAMMWLYVILMWLIGVCLHLIMKSKINVISKSIEKAINGVS